VSKKVDIPTYEAMMNPLLQALRELGGSGTVDEIADKVAQIMGLSDEQLEVLHNPAKGAQTEFEYRLAWTRTYLKRYGLLENSSRGVWALTQEGRKTTHVDEKEVVRFVREQLKTEKEELASEENETASTWQEELLSVLLQISPDSFERLIQRLLRECGFVQVVVTGRSGDGGIDGRGIMRIGGLLGFHVLFQCKRWRGSVGASQIRDFRGALVGRADKGLFITTGTFTKDAIREATRDGASPIDLMDGEQLVEKLKELSLGVKTEVVERVIIDRDWYLTL
jgi:restriction system protein